MLIVILIVILLLVIVHKFQSAPDLHLVKLATRGPYIFWLHNRPPAILSVGWYYKNRSRVRLQASQRAGALSTLKVSVPSPAPFYKKLKLSFTTLACVRQLVYLLLGSADIMMSNTNLTSTLTATSISNLLLNCLLNTARGNNCQAAHAPAHESRQQAAAANAPHALHASFIRQMWVSHYYIEA
eukprot:g17197.t1